MKIAIPIDINRLQKEIDLAESTNKFTTQSDLFTFIAQSDWAKKTYKKPLSASVLYLRYKQNALLCKTPKGKRGRGSNTEIKRTPRIDKLKINPNFAKNIENLKRDLPGKENLIDRIANGSMSAAVKANCLACCGGDKKLAQNCNVINCALYLFNPFMKTKE